MFTAWAAGVWSEEHRIRCLPGRILPEVDSPHFLPPTPHPTRRDGRQSFANVCRQWMRTAYVDLDQLCVLKLELPVWRRTSESSPVVYPPRCTHLSLRDDCDDVGHMCIVKVNFIPDSELLPVPPNAIRGLLRGFTMVGR